MRAWTTIGAFSNGRWRFGLRAGLAAVAATLAVTLLDPLLVRVLSRLGFGSMSIGGLSLSSLNPGNALTTFSRLWLIPSCFAFVAVKSVRAIEWITNAAARLLLHSGAVAGEFSPSRRTFFQYAACFQAQTTTGP